MLFNQILTFLAAHVIFIEGQQIFDYITRYFFHNNLLSVYEPADVSSRICSRILSLARW